MLQATLFAVFLCSILHLVTIVYPFGYQTNVILFAVLWASHRGSSSVTRKGSCGNFHAFHCTVTVLLSASMPSSSVFFLACIRLLAVHMTTCCLQCIWLLAVCSTYDYLQCIWLLAVHMTTCSSHKGQHWTQFVISRPIFYSYWSGLVRWLIAKFQELDCCLGRQHVTIHTKILFVRVKALKNTAISSYNYGIPLQWRDVIPQRTWASAVYTYIHNLNVGIGLFLCILA